MKTKYLIVGGGPAGVAAIEGIRRHDPEGEIVLLDEQGEPLYSKINLHFLMDKKMTAQNLYLKKNEFYEQNEVKFVREKVENLENYEYEKLILAYGGRPRMIDAPGNRLSGVYTFYSLREAADLADKIDSARDIAVIGGGFITLDILDSLQKTGKIIHLIVRSNQLLESKIGPLGAQIIKNQLSDNVKYYFNSEVKIFNGTDKLESVELKTGETVKCSLAIVAIGIEPDLSLAESLNIKTGRGILIDQKGQTSKQNIFAAGDICEFVDPVTQESMMAGNWLYALESGKVAGENAAGGDLVNTFVPIVAKNLLGLNLLFLGNVGGKYEKREFEGEGKYFGAFLKDDLLVGISAIGLGAKFKFFKSVLGEKFELEKDQILN